MDKSRLEAFSDGVLAIIITVMVLEIKVPAGADWAALRGLLPIFLSYVLSFVYVGIYWNNHHHMFQAVKSVSGGALWGNLLLLFWLSLFPFVTEWMENSHFAAIPTALYGVALLLAAISYVVLQQCLIALEGQESLLAKAVRCDWKGTISPVLYLIGIAACFWHPWIAQACYALVALIWLVPDRRIERLIPREGGS